MMNMINPDQQLVKIAVALTHGDDPTKVDLTCPFCKSSQLVYSYTVRQLPDQYGFYLICRNCGHGQHFSLSPQPPNFREDLVLPDFQKLEDQATQH